MGKIIEGSICTYLVVNTTEYNDDGNWAVQAVQFADLCDLGFDTEDLARIAQMPVSGVLSDWDYDGCVVIRVA